MKVYLLWSTLHRYGEKQILHGIYAYEAEAKAAVKEYQACVSVDSEEFHVQPYPVTVNISQKQILKTGKLKR